jgi:uncharacterized protein YjiS (DUF1127 family)
MPNPIARGLSTPADRVAPCGASDRKARPTSLIAAMRSTIRSWLARSRQRQALRELAELDDYLLKDIGFSRETAFREARKPFWQP